MTEPARPEKSMTLDEASDLVGDDIEAWLNNPFMPPDLMARKVCWWITRSRAEVVAEVLAVADRWDEWLPIRWESGRRVIDDIAVEDLTADLRAALSPAVHPDTSNTATQEPTA